MLTRLLRAAQVGHGRGDHLIALDVPRYARRWGLQAIGDDFPALYLEAVRAHATDDDGVCVLNVTWPAQAWLTRIARIGASRVEDQPATDPEILASLFANPTYVLLRRRNETKQARLLAARIRGCAPAEVGRKELERTREVITRQRFAWETYLASHRIGYLPVDYEDVQADPHGALTAIAERLGVDRPAGADSAIDLGDVVARARRGPTAAPPAASGREPGNGIAAPRTLFSVRPFRGHLHPMIPLMRACRRAGHKVAVASAEDMAQVITGAGLAWIPAGMNPREVESVYPDADGDYGIEAVGRKLADLLDLATVEFSPTAIVRDPTDLAAALAAEILGIEHVIYGLGHFIPRESWRILGADKTIAALRVEYGLPADEALDCLYRGLYLETLPRVFEKMHPLPVENIQRLRYVPWDGARPEMGADGGRPPSKGQKPTVLVTLGTVYNTNADLFQRFFEALAGEDLNVICTVGEDVDQETLGPIPDNVQLERYLPHSQILPRCDAMLCHAGLNTMLGALVCGVPLVCVPLGSDQLYNAERCAEHGLGLLLQEHDASPAVIREAVLRVLREPQFAENVTGFQQRVQRMPGPAATAKRLGELAGI